MDKDKIIHNIKEWVRIDELSVELRQKIRKLNQEKKKITDQLLETMKDREIDEFNLNQDGKLVRQTKRTKQPVNKKQLITCLTAYYKDEEDALKLTDYILESRGDRISETIRKK